MTVCTESDCRLNLDNVDSNNIYKCAGCKKSRCASCADSVRFFNHMRLPGIFCETCAENDDEIDRLH